MQKYLIEGERSANTPPALIKKANQSPMRLIEIAMQTGHERLTLNIG